MKGFILFKLYISINLLSLILATSEILWDAINLPGEHMSLFFAHHPQLAVKCRHDPTCPFKVSYFYMQIDV